MFKEDKVDINLNSIIQAIIGLLAVIIACYYVPWIKVKTANERQTYVWSLGKDGVYAAEQIYSAEEMKR